MDFVISSDDDELRHRLYLPRTQRPGVSATQWLAFRFRSQGLLTHSPGSHFAVVLRARIEHDADGIARSLSGRGMTVGDTAQAQPPSHPLPDAPFGGSPAMQVEVFWPGGNYLYRDTAVLCEGLQEEHWYHVQLHVNDARWVAFCVRDAQGLLLHPHPGPCVHDRAGPAERPDGTGVMIGLGRDRRETGPWRAEFRDVRHGWFATDGP